MGLIMQNVHFALTGVGLVKTMQIDKKTNKQKQKFHPTWSHLAPREIATIVLSSNTKSTKKKFFLGLIPIKGLTPTYSALFLAKWSMSVFERKFSYPK